MRVFKTRQFAKLASKARVSDRELVEAASRAEQGLVDATIGKFLIKLGKFLIKQRVSRRGEGRSGGFRTVVFFVKGDRAVYLHMFAKNARANLSRTEEDTFRSLAKALQQMSQDMIDTLVSEGKWISIGDDPKNKVSE